MKIEVTERTAYVITLEAEDGNSKQIVCWEKSEIGEALADILTSKEQDAPVRRGPGRPKKIAEAPKASGRLGLRGPSKSGRNSATPS